MLASIGAIASQITGILLSYAVWTDWYTILNPQYVVTLSGKIEIAVLTTQQAECKVGSNKKYYFGNSTKIRVTGTQGNPQCYASFWFGTTAGGSDLGSVYIPFTGTSQTLDVTIPTTARRDEVYLTVNYQRDNTNGAGGVNLNITAMQALA